MRKKKNYDKIIKNRFLIFLIGIISLFSIVLIKISSVMIFHQKEYKESLNHLTFSTVTGTSSPRGRIYDRNYNIIVDNKSLKTITYQKGKNVSNLEMIALAEEVSKHIDLDFNKITERNKKEYFFAKNKDYCDTLVSQKEKDKVEQRKITQNELDELKISRIPPEKIEFSDAEKKVAYLFYLMNRGYTYEEKIIKSDATDEEYAYISENNSKLNGFNTKIDWERIYPYGDTFKSILGTVSTTSQGIPAEEKDYYLEKGYQLNDRVGLSYIEKEYEEYLKGEKDVYEVVNSH